MKEKKFVGLDIHKETTAIVVIDQSGSLLMQSVVATQAEVICDFLAGLSGQREVTFEVRTQSSWLYRQVKPVVERVIFCNPRHNKLLQVGDKADLVDAGKSAELLRLGSLKEVWQHSAEQTSFKELVRSYETLLSDSTRLMNRIKAIYRSQAIGSAGTEVYRAEKRAEWLAKLTLRND